MVSTLSGPIPPHPYYDKGDVRTYLNLPAPRVRPEAQDIAQKGQGSVGGVMLHIEGQRVPSAASKHKTPPADHLKDNVRRMRQIQRESRTKQEEAKKPVKALWKSSKYENVPSKLKEQLQDSPHDSRPHSASYLRAHSRTGWTPVNRGGSQSAREDSSRQATPEPSVPRATSAREVKLVRHEVDFVKANGRAVKHGPQMRRSPSLTALDDLKKRQEDEQQNYQRGHVPKYLQTRRKQWEDEEAERLASQPDPDMPVGHRRMEDGERRDTLQKLQQTQSELLQQLGHMPIRTDTMTIRRKKEEIESKLADIEEAVKIFSRPKVFVKLDT